MLLAISQRHTPYKTAPSREPTSTTRLPVRSGRAVLKVNWSCGTDMECDTKSAQACKTVS